MTTNSSRRAPFLSALAAYGDCGTAERYVDMGTVGTEVPSLLTVPPTASPNRGQLMTALMMAIHAPLSGPSSGAVPAHIRFLTHLLGNNPSFPAGLDIGARLGTFAREEDVLLAIGRGRSEPVTRSPSPRRQPPFANVDISGDGTNDFYLTPMTRTGGVTAHRLNVRNYPGMSGSILTAMPRGTNVMIIGRHRGWYGIEHGNRVAFVNRRYVKLAP